MIIFLYGPDTYRSRQKLNEIIEHYKKIHKSGLNLRQFDLTKTDFSDLKNEIQSISMFKEKKLIILRNSFLTPEFEKNFLKEAKIFLNSKDIIIFHEESTNKKSQLFKFLKINSKSQEFELLKGQKLANWTKREFEKYQTKIEPQALQKLIDFVGNDLWSLSNEIKKLVAYKKTTIHAQRKIIEIKDVELLVKPKIETNIFETIDALANKNKKTALLLIRKHLEKGDSPSYILTMINFQFRNLLIIKDFIERRETFNNILAKSKIHPFIVRKSYFQSKKFNLGELKKIYQKIFQVDLQIKTSKIDPETALDLLITEI